MAVATSIFYDAVADAPTFDALDTAYGDVQGRPSGKLRPGVDSAGQRLHHSVAFRQEHMLLADRRFFRLIVEHVKTGNLLTNELSAFWKTATEELISRRVRTELESWLKDVEWSPVGSVSALIERARAHVEQVNLAHSQLRREVAQAVRQLGDAGLAARLEEITTTPVSETPKVTATSDKEFVASQQAQKCDNELVELLNRLGSHPFRQLGSVQDLERISEEAMVRAYGTNDSDEFKAFIEMLLYLHGNQINFNAKKLARAIVQVSARTQDERRAELLRTKLGQEAAERLFALGRGEPIEGWPQAVQIPQ